MSNFDYRTKLAELNHNPYQRTKQAWERQEQPIQMSPKPIITGTKHFTGDQFFSSISNRMRH